MTVESSHPFQFKTVFSLVVLTGKQAETLAELLELLEECDEAAIFYHTFRARGSHHYARGYYNDFAAWVGSDLSIQPLAEELSNLDVRHFESLRDVGGAIMASLRAHIERQPELASRAAHRPFHLSSVVSAVMPTEHRAHDLAEFLAAVRRISNQSLYFHFVESRLRVGPRTNDFSLWLEQQLGHSELGAKLNDIDLSTSTLDDARAAIVAQLEAQLATEQHGQEGAAS